jgi:hypothetical protein
LRDITSKSCQLFVSQFGLVWLEVIKISLHGPLFRFLVNEAANYSVLWHEDKLAPVYYVTSAVGGGGVANERKAFLRKEKSEKQFSETIFFDEIMDKKVRVSAKAFRCYVFRAFYFRWKAVRSNDFR